MPHFGGPGGPPPRGGLGGPRGGFKPKHLSLNKKPQPETPEPTVVFELTPANAVFEETKGHMLNVKVENKLFERVLIHSSFPHTAPTKYISVRTDENKEVGLIEDIEIFGDEQKELILKQIKLRYFAPEITKIISVKDEFGYTYWAVETTSGECRFTVRNGGGNIIHPTGNKYLITDVDGNRFVISDITKLPPKEYKMIDIYI